MSDQEQIKPTHSTPIDSPAPIDSPRYGPNGQLLCNARKNTCGAFACKPTKKCTKHGGKSLRGSASGTFKHGKFSKSLSGGLLTKYEEFRANRGNENVEAITLLDLLISEDAQKLVDTRHLWTDARKEFDQLTEALQDVDEETQAIIDQHKATLNSGEQDAQARESLRKNLDLQTKIVERDTRVKVLRKQMFTMEQVLIVAARTKDLIARFIPDEKKQEFEVAFYKEMEEANTRPLM